MPVSNQRVRQCFMLHSFHLFSFSDDPKPPNHKLADNLENVQDLVRSAMAPFNVSVHIVIN